MTRLPEGGSGAAALGPVFGPHVTGRADFVLAVAQAEVRPRNNRRTGGASFAPHSRIRLATEPPAKLRRSPVEM